MAERHLLGMIADVLAAKIEKAETTTDIVLELLKRDYLINEKNKTKVLTTDPEMARASQDARIEAVTKFKYLGVTPLSASDPIVIANTNKVCKNAN